MRWSRWIIAAVLPLVVACSAVRLSYNQGPTLAYWWLDGYVDFSAEQSPNVKTALDDWFAWHRANQLPDYAQALAAMGALAADKVTPAQVCSTVEAWQQRGLLAYDRALPAMTDLVRSLTPDQIRHIERQTQRKQKEAAAEFLQAEPAERQKANFERALDRAESLYGKLGDSQRRRLAADLLASPFNPERWLNERSLRTADTLRSLRQWQAYGSDSSAVLAGLRRFGQDAVQSPRADYRTYASTLMLSNCGLLAGLHNSTTPEQRQHAAAKLKGWEDDLRALVRR
jgi:hypothetical protein